ncbi:MAG: outer membrane lipoprotein-sorting protein [Brevinematia bacterium]
MYKTFITILIFLSFFSRGLFSLTAEEILKLVDEKRGPEGYFLTKMRVTSYKGDKIEESLEMKGYIKGNKSMVYFTSPAKWKGRKMLMIGNDVVMIFPNTSKPVRLSPSQRLMGNVANGDVARAAFSVDYNATLIGEERLDNKDCYRLKLSAKNTGTTYNSIDLWVEKDTFSPFKAVFYSLSGKELKQAYYSDLKVLAGSERISKITIYDSIRKDNYSVIEFLSMEKEEFSEKYFNIDYLFEM